MKGNLALQEGMSHKRLGFSSCIRLMKSPHKKRNPDFFSHENGIDYLDFWVKLQKTASLGSQTYFTVNFGTLFFAK